MYCHYDKKTVVTIWLLKNRDKSRVYIFISRVHLFSKKLSSIVNNFMV